MFFNRMVSVNKSRIPIFDALKGAAILLMIVNHVQLEGAWLGSLIGVFHMPLFFLVSGWLYKARSLKETIKNLSRKILLPYLVTCLVIFAIIGLTTGNIEWGLSILWGNSKPLSRTITGIGPLWFLTAYFCTMLLANILFKIPSVLYRWIILIVLFSFSVILVDKTRILLPFGVTTAVGGAIFLFAGMELKEFPMFFKNKRVLWLGITVWLICVIFGRCAMAWHIYKLNLLQVIGGIYGTYVCYLFIRQLKDSSYIFKALSFIGLNSLSILCIHSIDRVLGITNQLTTYVLSGEGSDISHWQLEILLKLLFVIIVFVTTRQIPIMRKIYQIK